MLQFLHLPSALAFRRRSWASRRARSLRSGVWFLCRSYSARFCFLVSTEAESGLVWSFSFRAFGGASPGRVLAVLFCGGGSGCFFLVLEQLPELAGSGGEKLNSKVVWPIAHLCRGYQTVGPCDADGRRIVPASAGSPGIEPGSNVSVLREF